MGAFNGGKDRRGVNRAHSLYPKQRKTINKEMSCRRQHSSLLISSVRAAVLVANWYMRSAAGKRHITVLLQLRKLGAKRTQIRNDDCHPLEGKQKLDSPPTLTSAKSEPMPHKSQCLQRGRLSKPQTGQRHEVPAPSIRLPRKTACDHSPDR